MSTAASTVLRDLPGPAGAADGPDPAARPTPGSARPRRARATDSAVGATLVTALGSALAMTPLRAVFGDLRWLLEAWAALAVVAAVLCLLRLRGPARLWHDAVAVLALVGFLVAVHFPGTAIAAVVPTTATVDELVAALERASSIIASSRPGLDSTASLRLITTATMVAVAIAIDLVAVVARLRALSGLAFLAIVTCAGAIGRGSIGLLGFVCAGGGFLLVLASGMAVERREWTESAAVHGSGRRAGVGGGGSGGRIAAGAIAFALAASTLIPLASDGLLSGAFSRSDGEGGGSASLSAFAKLQGSLNQAKEVPLLSVHITEGLVSDDPTVNPFYLRQIVLDDYATNEGWSGTGAGDKAQVRGLLSPELDDSLAPVREFSAEIEVLGLDDTSVPLFGNTRSVAGLGRDWRWNSSTGTIGGSQIAGGRVYSMTFSQPEPEAAQLQAARAGRGDAFDRWVQLPDDVPESVATLAAQITATQASDYGKAKALSDYFTDSANDFVYSTQTEEGDSGDALVDFLDAKTGFCQQYAAAMAVMLRTLEIPTRVVLGYTHQKPDDNSRFLVTTRDAHAWVEVYFEGYGWLPFDPTPLSGSDAGRDIPVPYAPDPGTEVTAPDLGASTTEGFVDDPLLEIPLVPDEVSYDAGTPFAIEQEAPAGRPYLLYGTLAAAAVAVLLLVPAASRAIAGRRRLSGAGATAAAWPWWQEYRALAQDLGQRWPDATTLREAPAVVGAQIPAAERRVAAVEAAVESAAALARLAERERFGRPMSADPAERGAIERTARGAIRHLRAAYPLRTRLGARWWPRSVRRAARAAISRRARAAATAPRALRKRLRRAA